MMFRRQLPVASPLDAGTLLGAAADTLRARDRSADVRDEIARRFDARAVVLTDSGTSALVLALRLLQADRPVAMPAYACVDLVAAARAAGVRVSLYDVDPATLSPDLDSVQRTVDDGVSGVVVAHLYGFPADVPAVRAIARSAGVPVIEDAAQHAGATLRGIPAGALGEIVVLSFGRGKGITSGNGGALLARGDLPIATAVSEAGAWLDRAAGARELAVAAASWALGRPSVYALPSAIPGLHLGETVYHTAGEPRRMSRAAAALLSRTLPEMDDAVATRRRNAFVLRAAADQSRHVQAVRAVEGGEPGYLRFPVLLRGDMRVAPAAGVVRAYPHTLAEEPEIRPILSGSAEPLHGAHELARRLVTLPTHAMVSQRDLEHLSEWLLVS